MNNEDENNGGGNFGAGGDEPIPSAQPPVRHVRIVDGVSSSKTYAVLATHGEHRLAIRWLGFKIVAERNRSGLVKTEGHTCMAGLFKAHIEKDGRKRMTITERAFTKFGLPEAFVYKQDRFTGIIEVPFAYTPNDNETLIKRMKEAPIAGALWAAVLEPAKEHGAEPDVDERSFGKWVKSQMSENMLSDISDDGSTEGYPTVKAWWTDGF